MPPTESKLLDNQAVEEIEALQETAHFNLRGRFQGQFILLTVAQRDALCATVKQLRQDNQRAETVFKFIVPNHPFATIEELAKPVLDKVDQLQSQLEQLRAENEALTNDCERWKRRAETQSKRHDEMLSDFTKALNKL